MNFTEVLEMTVTGKKPHNTGLARSAITGGQKKTQAIKPGFIFGGVKDYLSSPTSNIVESI
jgi:hypothetical protein